MKAEGKSNKSGVIDLELVSIEEGGVHIFIRGRINGKPARFLIDTGASRSVMDINRLSRFFEPGNMVLKKLEKLSTGLGTSSMESNLVILPLISFQRILIRNYNMAVLDMSHVNQSYSELGLKKIDAVIGGDLLTRFGAVIDYSKSQLKLRLIHPG